MFETPYKNAKIKNTEIRNALFLLNIQRTVTRYSRCILVWNQRIKVNFKCSFSLMLYYVVMLCCYVICYVMLLCYVICYVVMLYVMFCYVAMSVDLC